jgi:acyl dehydratase
MAAGPAGLSVGTRIPDREVDVRPESMRVFSMLTGDPNPIHWDVVAVRAQGLGDRPVNQGGLNAGYALAAVTAWAGSPAALREARFRFLGSVYGGDRVTAGGEISEVSADPAGVRVALRVWLRTEAGTDVVTGSAVVILPDPAVRPGPARE